MTKSRGAYLLITAFAAIGCVFLLFDHGEYDAASAFRNAIECADTSSDHCYQLYPGVIQKVRVAQTTSGEQDAVDIASRGSSIHVALTPTAANSPLLQAGAPVTVEWYVGSVVTVWIAALFLTVVLLNFRMQSVFAAVRVLPATAELLALSTRERILPSGTTGWMVRPRAQEALFLPLLVATLAAISVRPLMNPNTRLVALIGDTLLFAPVIVRLALTFRNARVIADHTSISYRDWLGRTRSWPLAQIHQAAIVGVRWTDWAVPAVLFIAPDGEDLFVVTSLNWNLDEIGALCVTLGIPLSFGYDPPQSKRLNRVRLAMNLVGVLITGALLVASFLPIQSGAD